VISQQGSTLVVSLVLLVALTLLGVSSLQSTLLEEKMAGNYKDSSRAFQATEAALRAGEDWLQVQAELPNALPSNIGNSDVWSYNAPSTGGSVPNWWNERDEVWWGNNGVSYTAQLDGVTNDPEYLIEEQSFIRDTLNVGIKTDNSGRVFYRVTSRGTGARPTTRSLLQSTYTRRY